MIRSWAYNRFGVLMGTSSRASCPRWPSLRGNSWPMITLFSSQGDFCATAIQRCKETIQEWLKGMGLELKDAKTRYAHTLEAKEECNGNVGFDFLGFTIRQYPVGKYV